MFSIGKKKKKKEKKIPCSLLFEVAGWTLQSYKLTKLPTHYHY